MIYASQVRDQLAKYLDDQVSLDDFEDWLVQNSWNMHRDSDQQARDLVAQIELALSEHSSGHLDVDELRTKLRRSSVDTEVRR